jgi:hypothetical protein
MIRFGAYRERFPNARLTRSKSGVLEVALHTEGRVHTVDNPLLLANRKAKPRARCASTSRQSPLVVSV